MNNSFGAILALLIAFQLMFAAIFLFTHRKGNRRNNKILGLIFLLFSLSIGDFTCRVMGITFPLPAMHWIDDGFFFLYGPLLYIYTKYVTQNDFKFNYKSALHFIPYSLYIIYLIYLLITIDSETQNNVLKDANTQLSLVVIIFNLTFYTHLYSYLWTTNSTFSIYKSAIKDRFSSIDEINLDWLNFMIKAMIAITTISFIHNLLPIFGNVYFNAGSLIALLIFLFYFINRVLIKALNQPEIFSGISSGDLVKYAGSNLSDEDVNHNKSRLEHLLYKDKMYLNPDLSISDLSEKMEKKSKLLSQVINQGFDMSFFDLVNTYRCEEVKHILQNSPDPKITITEAMYQAGFNSKSSFNKEFKKLTGQTPSEFKKSLIN
jgi:AraC-like DNA-binding protein